MTRILIDSTLVAVVTARPTLISTAHRDRLADTEPAGDISVNAASLQRLWSLVETHEVTVYVGASQLGVAAYLRAQKVSVAVRPFHDLVEDAELVVLPEHRAIDLPDALRVPALGLHELEVR